MATAQTIINRALRLCKVLDSFQAASSEDASDALNTLNGLMAELYEAEVGIPDYTFALLTTALASDDADADALAYMLARRIAPEYGVELSRGVISEAEKAEGRMRLRYFQPGCVDFSELPSEAKTYNINTDT